jgi:hypothetical protein
LRFTEAKAAYIPKGPTSRPLDNRRIRTFLKSELRRRAENLLEQPWQKIVYDYTAVFTVTGSPSAGTATLALTDGNLCHGFGSRQKPQLRIGFSQRDLFEAAERRAGQPYVVAASPTTSSHTVLVITE